MAQDLTSAVTATQSTQLHSLIMKTKLILPALLMLGLAATNLFAVPKDGDLVKNSSGTVFLIKDGQRCGIPNPKTFKALGFKWTNVVDVADTDLAAIPEGPALTNPDPKVAKREARRAAAKAAASIQPYPTPQDGDALQSIGGVVFLIRDGKRCLLPNGKIFEALGLAWEKVIRVSDHDLEAIPKGEDLLLPYKKPMEKDLLRGSSEAVFVIRNGKRCGIASGEQFKELGFKWDNVVKISDADLEAIPEGDLATETAAKPLTPYKTAKENDLIQSRSEAVFVIRGGKRCGIASGEQFKELGFKWENVIHISDEDLEAIPEGSL